jgi:hypothetical protein
MQSFWASVTSANNIIFKYQKTQTLAGNLYERVLKKRTSQFFDKGWWWNMMGIDWKTVGLINIYAIKDGVILIEFYDDEDGGFSQILRWLNVVTLDGVYGGAKFDAQWWWDIHECMLSGLFVVMRVWGTWEMHSGLGWWLWEICQCIWVEWRWGGLMAKVLAVQNI